MENADLRQALERAERAIDRVEQALQRNSSERPRDEALRARVRDAIAQLDQLIQGAEV